MERLKQITEDTLIPLGLVILLFGFVSWLTTLHAETKEHGQTIAEIKEEQRENNTKLDQIIHQLGRIEGRLRLK